MSLKHQVESYLLTDLEVSGIDSNNFIDLPKVYTQKSIPVSTENIPTQKDMEKCCQNCSRMDSQWATERSHKH